MSKQSYDFLFSVLKGFENREPDGLSKFNFTAHGRDQNIRFNLYQGRNPTGTLKFEPLGEDFEAPNDNFALVTDQLPKNIMAKYASFGKYKEASLRTVEAFFQGFVGRVVHHELTVMPDRIVMKALLMEGDDLMPDGHLFLDMKVLRKTDYELRMEALKEHMAKMHKRQEEGLPVHRLGEPDPLAENSVKEPESVEEAPKPLVSGLEMTSGHDSLTTRCKAPVGEYKIVDRAADNDGVAAISPDQVPTV